MLLRMASSNTFVHVTLPLRRASSGPRNFPQFCLSTHCLVSDIGGIQQVILRVQISWYLSHIVFPGEGQLELMYDIVLPKCPPSGVLENRKLNGDIFTVSRNVSSEKAPPPTATHSLPMDVKASSTISNLSDMIKRGIAFTGGGIAMGNLRYIYFVL